MRLLGADENRISKALQILAGPETSKLAATLPPQLGVQVEAMQRAPRVVEKTGSRPGAQFDGQRVDESTHRRWDFVARGEDIGRRGIEIPQEQFLVPQDLDLRAREIAPPVLEILAEHRPAGKGEVVDQPRASPASTGRSGTQSAEPACD